MENEKSGHLVVNEGFLWGQVRSRRRISETLPADGTIADGDGSCACEHSSCSKNHRGTCKGHCGVMELVILLLLWSHHVLSLRSDVLVPFGELN